MAAAARLVELAADRGRARDVADRAYRAASAAQAEVDRLTAEWAATAPARRALARLAEMETELRRLDAEQQDLQLERQAAERPVAR